jgi:PAS domain S-box-containing protein
MLGASTGGLTLWHQQRELIVSSARNQAKLSSRGLAVVALPEADERAFLVPKPMLARVNGLIAAMTFTYQDGAAPLLTQTLVPEGGAPLDARWAAATESLARKLAPLDPEGQWPTSATIADSPSGRRTLVSVSRLDAAIAGREGFLVAVIDGAELEAALDLADRSMGLAAIPKGLISLATGLVAWRIGRARDLTLERLARLNTRQANQRRELLATIDQLNTVRERLDLVISATRDGTWEHDLASGTLTTSDRLLELLGYTREQLAPTWLAFFTRAHPDDARGLLAAVEAHTQTGATLDIELRLAGATGEYRWYRLRGNAARDAAGRATRLAGSLSDIHAQREADERLCDYTEELWESRQALEARAEQLRIAQGAAETAARVKSEFLANMSHEIRTPMTAILGYSDLLLDPRQSPTERAECVHTIRRSGQHLLALINDILDLSKIEAGKMTIESIPARLVEVLDEALALVQAQAAAKGITLGFDAASPLPQVIHTDPTRLRQVITNLLSNAVKFTSAGGVRVIASLDAHETLRIEVHDTGIGISPEQLATLFKPFSQADGSMTRRFGGTGLGLCISSKIVTLLGGELSVTSTPGQGSCFNVTLPRTAHTPQPGTVAVVQSLESERASLTAGASQRSIDAPPAQPVPDVAGMSILLAEDGPDNQRLLGTLIRRAGVRLKIVENGQLAFDAAVASVTQHDPFDLILMDMQMPVLDGYSATAKLRAAGWDRPIIALTAHALREDRDKCIRAGCDDYATKPIAKPALIDLIARWRGKRASGPAPSAAA